MPSLRRILLAEDDEHDVELTVLALQAHHRVNPEVVRDSEETPDYHIDVVRDGEQALDYLKRRGRYQDRPPGLPAVILLDIKMPKLDGHEVLKSIRADRELRFLPVVMLTSSNEHKDLMASYSSGANAYVVKPVDFKAFAVALRHLGVFWALLNVLPEQDPRA